MKHDAFAACFVITPPLCHPRDCGYSEGWRARRLVREPGHHDRCDDAGRIAACPDLITRSAETMPQTHQALLDMIVKVVGAINAN